MRIIKQSSSRNVLVMMVLASDHITGATGLTLTITASKDGAAFASITPTVTERGSGWYSLNLTAGHTDTLGDLALHITGTAADPTDLVCQVVAFDPTSATSLGLSNLDATVSSRLASASYTAPDNTSVATILTRTDVATSTRLATSGYTAPDNASVTAIKAKTDSLAFTVAGQVDANIESVNAITVRGSGTSGDPWGP